MARQTSGEQREANSNGRRASVTNMGGAVGSRRASQPQLFSVGSTNGRADARVEEQDRLHQQIAELAYVLYERSGFQDGNDLEHWLEAERQVKGLLDQAA
jgi:Protein of unknown function (DUF2934)